MPWLYLALIVVALVLAGIEAIRSRGDDLVAWAAMAIAAALLLLRYA